MEVRTCRPLAKGEVMLVVPRTLKSSVWEGRNSRKERRRQRSADWFGLEEVFSFLVALLCLTAVVTVSFGRP